MNWFQVPRSDLFVVNLFDIKCVFTSFFKINLDLRNKLILENTECNGEVYLAPNHINWMHIGEAYAPTSIFSIFKSYIIMMNWFEKINPWLKSV